MLCAKLPKCNTTLFPEDDIKIYDASKSTAVFLNTQSCLYQYLWICKVSSLEDILSLRSLLRSKRDMFSLVIFLNVIRTVELSHQSGKTPGDVTDWESSWNTIGGWNGSILHRNLITKAMMGTTTTDDDDDDIVVYVKGNVKREWLRDLLLDEAREDVYVENIEAHYEDIESLNNECYAYLTLSKTCNKLCFTKYI